MIPFFLGILLTVALVVGLKAYRRRKPKAIYPTYRDQRLAELEVGIGLDEPDVKDYFGIDCKAGTHRSECMDFCVCLCHKDPEWVDEAKMKAANAYSEAVQNHLRTFKTLHIDPATNEAELLDSREVAAIKAANEFLRKAAAMPQPIVMGTGEVDGIEELSREVTSRMNVLRQEIKDLKENTRKMNEWRDWND